MLSLFRCTSISSVHLIIILYMRASGQSFKLAHLEGMRASLDLYHFKSHEKKGNSYIFVPHAPQPGRMMLIWDQI